MLGVDPLQLPKIRHRRSCSQTYWVRNASAERSHSVMEELELTDLGDPMARIAGQSVEAAAAPILEELVRAILGVQSEQMRLLKSLAGHVGELLKEAQKLLDQSFDAGRDFLVLTAMPRNLRKARLRDLRRARGGMAWTP